MNRLPRSRKNKEKVIALDKFGWFQETRRRKRRAFLERELPRLRMAKMCINACAAVLHCAVRTLYEGGIMEELGLLTGRRFGDRRERVASRRGMPSMGMGRARGVL